MKIVETRIEKNCWYLCTLVAKLEDGSETNVFHYYPDKFSFSPEQFIGKTVGEARKIHFQADIGYFRNESRT